MKAGNYMESICNDLFWESCMPVPYVCFKSQSMQAYNFEIKIEFRYVRSIVRFLCF